MIKILSIGAIAIALFTFTFIPPAFAGDAVAGETVFTQANDGW